MGVVGEVGGRVVKVGGGTHAVPSNPQRVSLLETLEFQAMEIKARKYSISSKSRKITDLVQISAATSALLITNKEKYSEKKGGETS